MGKANDANADIPTIESVDFTRYDFLDFGSSEGGSIQFSESVFEADRGLGIDRDPEKVKTARDRGFECVVGDLAKMTVPENCVDFVIINHVLEHLPDLDTAKAVVEKAVHAARDFVFIKGPYFDADAYLAQDDLKMYWADWTGHPLHLTSAMLAQILETLGLSDYLLLGHELIRGSDDSNVHPVGAPHNKHEYLPEYGFKSSVRFQRPVFREIICIVELENRPPESDLRRWSLNLYKIESVGEDTRAKPLTPIYSWIRIRGKIVSFLKRIRGAVRPDTGEKDIENPVPRK